MRTEDIAPFVAVGQELERRKVRLLQGEGEPARRRRHRLLLLASRPQVDDGAEAALADEAPPAQLRAAFRAQSHRSEPEPGPLSSVSATLPLSHTMIPTCCILRGRMESRTRDRFFTGECWQPGLTEATLALRRCAHCAPARPHGGLGAGSSGWRPAGCGCPGAGPRLALEM